MLSRPLQLLRFLLVGVANTAVGLGTIFLLKWAAGMDDVPANLIGYLLGLCLSFALNRNWTFGHRGALLPAALRFAAVFAVAYAANLLTVLLLRDVAGLNSYLCHVLAMFPYTALFFIGSRVFVFASRPESPGAREVAP